MRIDCLPRALKALDEAPADVRRALFKQVKFLEQDLRHPSLPAKKYDAMRPLASGFNKDWRFYFNIVNATYVIRDIIPHPK